MAPLPSYRDVLVVIDGSARSSVAVGEASTLARTHNARMTLLCVQPAGLRWLSMFTGAPPLCLPRPSEGQLDQASREDLDQAIARVPTEIPLTTILSREPPRSALLKAIEKGSHDVVIIGTRRDIRIPRSCYLLIHVRTANSAFEPSRHLA
jgi:nucleotide-binding universal stress UspA family protein